MSVRHMIAAHKPPVLRITGDMTLAEAAAALAEKRIGLAVVCDEHIGLLGVLSERDIIRVLGNDGAIGLNRLVKDAMTKRVVTCSPLDSLEDVIKVMAENGIRHLPVVEHGKVTDVLSMRDAMKYLNKSASDQQRGLFLAKIAWG